MRRRSHRDVVVSRSRSLLAMSSVFACVQLAGGCTVPTPVSIAQSAAAGTSRLLVRNLTSVASIINDDTKCGFASAAVLASPTLNGTIGSRGSMTWTVTDCEYDGGGGTEYTKDCNDVTKTASGKFMISATKTVTGTLTGVPTSPIIPDGPNAFAAQLTKLSFDKFKIVDSSSTSWLEITKGNVTGKLERLLAVLASNGVCGFATDNAKLTDIVVKDMEGHVSGESAEIDVTVSEANLKAFAGDYVEKENDLTGDITLTSQVTLKRPVPGPPGPPSPSQKYTLPVTGDTTKLDPNYDHDKFISGYSCDATMLKPQSYLCADLTPSLADGAARLTVKAFATVASLVDKNTTCGFSSPNVTVAMQPPTPGVTGTLSLTLTAPCTITIPADTLGSPDCGGVQSKIGGSFTVTGTKVVAGRLTGNNASPVIPMSDSPATITLQAAFTDFSVGSSNAVTALRVKSGTLAGVLQPRVALASDTLACSVSTPIAKLNNLVWTNAALQVVSTSGTIDLPVSTASLNATNGTWGTDSNLLSGSLTVGTRAYTVPGDNKGLDPAFTQAAFDAAYACTPNMITPVNHTCAFVLPLAQGTARLIPRNLGAVLSAVNADTTCGFSAVPGTTSRLGATPSPGPLGLGSPGSTLTLSIPEATPCTITTFAAPSPDCNGATTTPTGSITVWGTKTISGFLTGDTSTAIGPIVPTSWEPAVFDLRISFNNFRAASSVAGSPHLTITDGAIHTVITPRTAIDKASGACSKSTPIIKFDPIEVTTTARTVLNNGGNIFNLSLGTTTALRAQNGNGETTNTLTGTLSMDGVDLTIPVTGADTKLDPAFDQAAFDLSYQCAAANLVPAPASAACSFRRSLAMGVARLLIKDVATATGLINGAPGGACGYNATGAAPAPQVTFASAPANGVENTATLTIPEGTPCAVNTAGFPQIPNACITTPAALVTNLTGTFTDWGTKVIAGRYLTAAGMVPITRMAATFNQNFVFTGFQAFDMLGPAPPDGKLTITGPVTLTMKPVAGQSISSSMALGFPVYRLSTPIAAFERVSATGVTATLVKTTGATTSATFKVTITASDLNAFAGTYNDGATTRENELTGSITLDGEAITLPLAGSTDVGLQPPPYSRAAVEATYWSNHTIPACDADLTAPIPN